MSDEVGQLTLDGKLQSALAQSFSDTLDNAFGINNTLNKLSKTVEQKKQDVSSQSTELEILKARLKATEVQLRERQLRSSPLCRGNAYASTSQLASVSGTIGVHQKDTNRATSTSQHSSASKLSFTGSVPLHRNLRAPLALPETASVTPDDYYKMANQDGHSTCRA